MLALLIVDVQNALIDLGPFNKEKLIMNIRRLIASCRKNDVEVIYVQHSSGEGSLTEYGTHGWEIYNEIKPFDGEKIFHKIFNSSFRETGLKDYLDQKGINELIIVGMQTDFCIDTTVKVAFEYGYKVTTPVNTNSTYDNGGLTAKQIHDYYNNNIFFYNFSDVPSVESVIERIEEND
jgi:nicotinamidase-related amidase